MEVNAVGETGLVHKLLASDAIGALADQVGFDLAGGLASEDQRMHNSLDAFLGLHHAAAVHHAKRLIRIAGLVRWQRDAVGDHLRVGGGQALAKLLSQKLGDADAAAAVGFRGEGFGDAPVIGVVGMHGEDPGQALAASVGGGDVVRVQALGKEQIGLHLVEELEGLLGVCLQEAGSARGMDLDAVTLQGREDRRMMEIVAKVVEMHHHLVARLNKLLTEADQPGGDAADVCASAVVGNGDLHGQRTVNSLHTPILSGCKSVSMSNTFLNLVEQKIKRILLSPSDDQVIIS